MKYGHKSRENKITKANLSNNSCINKSALDRFKKCQAKIIEPACGKEAVEVGNTVMKGIFSRAATVTCEKYKAESTVCKNLLPPTGTVPKGAKSKSVLSKLLSTMTQA